jgi:ankyrin repeat protein
MATLHQVETADQVINLYNQGHGEPNYYSLYLTTPLHSACQKGKFEVIRQLCEFNADLSAENFNKELPIDEAAKFGDVQIVEFIIKQMLRQVKNITSIVREIYREQQKTTIDSNTFFQEDKEKCIEYLILYAPYCVNRIINLSSSIHYAILYANNIILNYLMKFKFDLNDVKTITTQYNKVITGTPLMIACFTQNVNIINQLLHAKSIVVKTDLYGNFQQFLNPKVNVNMVDERGNNAIMALLQKGCSFEIIKSLIVCGINVNHRDNKGRTALRKVSKTASAELVSELITIGCDINLQCNKGVTPLMVAIRYKNYDVVLILLNAGVDVTIVNNFGNRAIDYADPEMLDIISNYHLFN